MMNDNGSFLTKVTDEIRIPKQLSAKHLADSIAENEIHMTHETNAPRFAQASLIQGESGPIFSFSRLHVLLGVVAQRAPDMRHRSLHLVSYQPNQVHGKMLMQQVPRGQPSTFLFSCCPHQVLSTLVAATDCRN